MPRNTKLVAQTSQNNELPHSRGLLIIAISSLISNTQPSIEIIENLDITQDKIKEIAQTDKQEPIVFINCSVKDIDLNGLEFKGRFAFFECSFSKNFRLINCKINDNLWLINNTFENHFSLKNCVVNGNVHLEGSNFRGHGGISFRGMKAHNLFLDFGVLGSDDMVWLNELNIEKTLSIGGSFCSEIQILGDQDLPDNETTSNKIGWLCIGQELYGAEKANRTEVLDKISIKGINLHNGMVVTALDVESLIISRVTANTIKFIDLSCEKDLCVFRTTLTGKDSLIIEESSIGRHLKIDENFFAGRVSFDGTAVSEVCYLENDNFREKSSLSLNRFTASRFLINPVEILYRKSRRYIFKPRKFGLLEEDTNKSKLGDQYCSLKHWLSDGGKLEMEDIAYFHMCEYYHNDFFSRLLFGRIFGWGVRLTNIAISSLLLVFIFSLMYMTLDKSLDLSHSFVLSIQSFISSFFGVWAEYDPSGILSFLVTVESMLGILFITVFIGAYIRKLLR